ncbi:unnamed protein product [Adineta ricciae]|nr:unnamed protein product [Adineta ricciae]
MPVESSTNQTTGCTDPSTEKTFNSKTTVHSELNNITRRMAPTPPHVYSCFIVNHTVHPIECTLKYNGRPEEEKFDEVINVIVEGKSEHYFPRKFFQPDLPKSYCKWVKIITHVRVKRTEGEILEVSYPFDDVDRPVRNWEFHIQDTGDILSKPPTRIVNVFKYENMDQYEC